VKNQKKDKKFLAFSTFFITFARQKLSDNGN
jgi:hypothetical protein